MTFLSFESQMDKAGSTGSQEGLFLHWNKETPTPLDGMSVPSPPMVPTKKKTTRRAGSCEPCRKSKIKCDGKKPECTGCSKRKRAKCKDPCHYIPSKERSARRQQTIGRSERRATSPLSVISEDSDEPEDEDSSPSAANSWGPPRLYGSDDFVGAFSFARSIDKFKSMCPRATGVKVPDAAMQCNGIEAFDALPFPKAIDYHELLVPKPQHSLSHYLPSTDLDLMPAEIREIGWKAINIKEKMIDDGRMHEAYKEFAGLAREARFFRGLNNNPRAKSASKSLQAQIEQKIYRLIVDMDIRICTHLGMTLEVQPDKIPPSTTFTAMDADPWVSELEQSQSDFRQLAFDILTQLPSVSDDDEVTTSPRILEDLSLKWDHLQELCSEDPAIPDASPAAKLLLIEHLIDRRALSILLACTLGDQKSRSPNAPVDTAIKRERKLPTTGNEYTQAVLESAEDVLALFASLGSLSDDCTWTCAHAVFCAAAIISIAILNGTYQPRTVLHVKNAVDYFSRATRQRGKGYGLVSAPLNKMWPLVQAATKPKAEKRRGDRPEESSPVVKHEAKHVKKTPPAARRKRQPDTTDDESVEHTVKRTRRSPRMTRADLTPTALTFGQEMIYSQHHPTPLPPDYGGVEYGGTAGYDTSEPSSANVSFSSSADPFHTNLAICEDNGVVPGWFYPPLTEAQPPHRRDLIAHNRQYGNAQLDLWRHNQYLATSRPEDNMVPASQGPIHPNAWQMSAPTHGTEVLTYGSMPPQDSRRGSAVSQHDYNATTHAGWAEHHAAFSGAPHPPLLYPQYSSSMYYGNVETPLMMNPGTWNHEQYQYDGDVTEDESTWQQEQAYNLGQRTLSLGCGL